MGYHEYRGYADWQSIDSPTCTLPVANPGRRYLEGSELRLDSRETVWYVYCEYFVCFG
jgi:hypothetical protein